MAALSDTNRAAIWADFMRLNPEPLSITKADLRAAVNAMDDFLENNSAAMNTSIPQPARSALSAQQKAYLLKFVIDKRYLNT